MVIFVGLTVISYALMNIWGQLSLEVKNSPKKEI